MASSNGLGPGSVRVLACGMTESGKDYQLRRLFLDRQPRALVLDPLGEWRAAAPAGRTYRVRRLADLAPTLTRAAKEGTQWRIYAALGADAAPAIADLLVPEVAGRDLGAFPQHVGGMALYVPECDLFAATSADPKVVGLWRRGRHTDLTILAASQRPHGISRIVTAMSGWLIVTRTIEPRDLLYLKGFIPPAAYLEVSRLQWQWAVLVDTRAMAWYLMDRDGKIARQGNATTEAAPAL